MIIRRPQNLGHITYFITEVVLYDVDTLSVLPLSLFFWLKRLHRKSFRVQNRGGDKVYLIYLNYNLVVKPA